MPTPTNLRRVSPRLRNPVRRGTSAPATRAVANARQRAEGLIAEVKRRKRRIASDFYEMGRALAELSEPACYEALGYDNFDALLKGRKLVSRVQAHKLVEVARTYPRNVALKLGVEKAYLLSRYVAATPAADLAVELARRNARIDGQRLNDTTVADLRAATKRAKRGGAAVDAAVLREARRKARAIQRELRRRGARKAVVRAEPEGGGATLVVRLPAEQADVLLG